MKKLEIDGKVVGVLTYDEDYVPYCKSPMRLSFLMDDLIGYCGDDEKKKKSVNVIYQYPHRNEFGSAAEYGKFINTAVNEIAKHNPSAIIAIMLYVSVNEYDPRIYSDEAYLSSLEGKADRAPLDICKQIEYEKFVVEKFVENTVELEDVYDESAAAYLYIGNETGREMYDDIIAYQTRNESPDVYVIEFQYDRKYGKNYREIHEYLSSDDITKMEPRPYGILELSNSCSAFVLHDDFSYALKYKTLAAAMGEVQKIIDAGIGDITWYNPYPKKIYDKKSCTPKEFTIYMYDYAEERYILKATIKLT